MLFSSPIFLFLFLPILLLIYFFIGRRFPNPVLLIASILFYTWGEPTFIGILFLVIFLNYLISLSIQKYVDKKDKLRARIFLLVSILLNLGILIYYKYRTFFIVPVFQNFLNFFHPTFIPDTISHFILDNSFYLPLAISFFTFHAISYNVDVYQKKSKAQKNISKLFLYFLFFPHLLAGPILRYHLISAQLNKRIFKLEQFTYGINRFIMGLGKKLLIADRLSLVSDEIFAIPLNHLDTPAAWLAIICFTLQIYFDFSAYSDMAIGLARMFGFTFPENFNYPYISASITEFWRRWHITLSNWFKEYVYIPLGGNRVAIFRVYINLWIVFLLCGLWHGASWNFIVWGIIHGSALVLERIRDGLWLNLLWKPFRYLYTLLIVMIGWVFFRSDSIEHSLNFLAILLGLGNKNVIEYRSLNYFLQPDLVFILVLSIILIFPIYPNMKARINLVAKNNLFTLLYPLTKLSFLFIILVLSCLAAASQTYNAFLYFRF